MPLLTPETFSSAIRYHSPNHLIVAELSLTHHERSELSDGHDGFVDVYVPVVAALAMELHGGAEVEGGDHGAGATDAVGAVHQSRAVAGEEATD